jgi:hypothetical protein
VNGSRARLFGTAESALAILCPHCRGPVEVHVLAGPAPALVTAAASLPPAMLGGKPGKIRHCACGHPSDFHAAGGAGECLYGLGITGFGKCECGEFHRRARGSGKAAANGAALVDDGAGPSASAAAAATNGAAPVADGPPAVSATSGERTRARILRALKQREPDASTAKQIALMAGYSMRGGQGSGSFRSALAKLRAAGEILKEGNRFRLTTRGHDAAGPVPPLATGGARLQFFAGLLGACAGSVLQRVTLAYPAGVDVAELREVLGYSTKGNGSGSFRSALADLRALDLLVRTASGALRATDGLMERVRAR